MIPLGVLASAHHLSAPAGPLFEYVGVSGTVQSSAATTTFTGLDIGAASASRVIAVAISANILDTRTLSAVTIGGVSATLSAQSDNYYAANIAYATVPTGTTADVVTTWVGTHSNGHRCAVYRSEVAVTVTASSATRVGATSANRTLTTAAGGTLIACVGGFNNTSAISWTNATEDYEASSVGSPFPASTSSAHEQTTAGSVTVTVTKASSDSHLSLAAVAFQPA